MQTIIIVANFCRDFDEKVDGCFLYLAGKQNWRID